uniref:Ras-related and estrogen-regulated growth inhibitor n=1 Tax=Papilio xuthus TaxID=66420 RepID=I4DP35_PAPXU|nr:unknown unsecreted protein [Papilio xuthus]
MKMTVNRIRVVVLGSARSGKSAVVVRYLTKRYIGEYSSTGGEYIISCTIPLCLAFNVVIRVPNCMDIIISNNRQTDINRFDDGPSGRAVSCQALDANARVYLRMLASPSAGVPCQG